MELPKASWSGLLDLSTQFPLRTLQKEKTINLYYYYFMSDKVVKANTHGRQKAKC